MPYQVLFLDDANAAHSIMGEAVLNALGGGRFRAHSAGRRPMGSIDARILEVLATNGYGTHGARSKGLSDFIGAQSPAMDFVIVLASACPMDSLAALRGRPVVARWALSDPPALAVDGGAARRAYLAALGILRRRIQHLCGIPFDSLGDSALREELRQIGRL